MNPLPQHVPLIDKSTLSEIREQLGLELFYCERYSATITKLACSNRRREIYALQSSSKPIKIGIISESNIQLMQYKRCVDCAQDWPEKYDDKRHIPSMPHTRQYGPKPKPVPDRCPKCGKKINQQSRNHHRYNHKQGMCSTCCVTLRNIEVYNAKKAGKSTLMVCSNADKCAIKDCMHRIGHKHKKGQRVEHTCTIYGVTVRCNFS